MLIRAAACTTTGEFAINHDGWHAANAMLLRARGVELRGLESESDFAAHSIWSTANH